MERLFIAFLVLGLILLIAVVGPALLRRRALARARRAARPVVAERATTHRPLVIYFSTEDCVQCAQRQAPALARLADRYGPRLTIRSVDALAERELADQYGVLTVPTTVVLDAAGTVRAVNLGYASDDTLASQLGLN